MQKGHAFASWIGGTVAPVSFSPTFLGPITHCSCNTNHSVKPERKSAWDIVQPSKSPDARTRSSLTSHLKAHCWWCLILASHWPGDLRPPTGRTAFSPAPPFHTWMLPGYVIVECRTWSCWFLTLFRYQTGWKKIKMGWMKTRQSGNLEGGDYSSKWIGVP